MRAWGGEAGPLPVAVSFVIGPAGQVVMSPGLIWMGVALLLEQRAGERAHTCRRVRARPGLRTWQEERARLEPGDPKEEVGCPLAGILDGAAQARLPPDGDP